MEVITKNAEETKAFGRKIADKLVHTTKNIQRQKGAVVLALVGELGSGKTTFIQGLAEGLKIEKRILSPTFVLMRQYTIPPITNQQSPINYFFHIDLYRLESNITDEIKNLGMDEVLTTPENIVAIEWAEKAKDFMPEGAVWINFEYKQNNTRTITVKNL